MDELCLLITKPPHSGEDAERMCGLVHRAREKGGNAAVFLMGDGVLCAKKGQQGFVGKNIRDALQNDVEIKASAADLKARALGAEFLESGIEVVDDIEGMFVEYTMERAGKVVTW